MHGGQELFIANNRGDDTGFFLITDIKCLLKNDLSSNNGEEEDKF